MKLNFFNSFVKYNNIKIDTITSTDVSISWQNLKTKHFHILLYH